MPDPKLDFWTAAWNLAVDQHITSPTWKNSMRFLGLPDRQREFIETMLRAIQQLPEEAGLDIRLLVEARQNHDLEKIRGDWHDLPLSIRTKLEALARGEVKTIKPNWEEPFLPEMTVDEDFDDERITSKLPYANHMGPVMNRGAYVAASPAPRDTLPVPKNFQASLEARSRLAVPLIPQAGTLPCFEDADESVIDEQWTDLAFEDDEEPES